MIIIDEQLYLLTGIANQRKSDPAYGPIRVTIIN